MTTASDYRRKRGVVKCSITSLSKRLTELEESTDSAESVHSHVQRLSTRLQNLDSEFRTIHYQIVGAIAEGEDETLDGEQATLDKHDIDVDGYSVRIQQLLFATMTTSVSTTADSSDKRRSLARVIAYLEESLQSIKAAFDEELTDMALVQQYQEELTDLKTELSTCHEISTTLNLKEDDELVIKYIALKGRHFEYCRKGKSILLALTSATTSTTPPSATVPSTSNLKIPKLESPTFDGDILNWTRFWEQFSISINEREGLTDAEKFVYLQQSLKGGSAKTVIEGLSGTGEHYVKAIECLKTRYDRPRLIHQSHVKVIIEMPPLKDGNGKELRRLHDLLQQHLRALDADDKEGLNQFVTSIIQLKLDPDTLFEWQKHTQDIAEVPPFQKLLEFIDLRARASETTPHVNKRIHHKPEVSKKTVASFVTSSEATNGRCVICKSERHPLYYCPRFKEMNHDRKMAIVKSNKLCLNSLKGGHFLKDCKSPHHCRTCQKPHHTLLHLEPAPDPEGLISSSTVVSNNTAVSNQNILMMTCQVLIKSHDGTRVKVRALLDSASSSSFVSERVVQGLCLRRSPHNVSISGVAGLTGQSQLRSIANIEISSIKSPEDDIPVTAIVVPKVTCELPLHPVELNSTWTHLNGLILADQDFGRPGRIDLLLGTDMYVGALLNGRRSGPPNSPVAFETIFGWVLAGKTDNTNIVSSHLSVATLHASTCSELNEDVLQKFWEIEEVPMAKFASVDDKCVLEHFKKTHRRMDDGRFEVTLCRRPGVAKVGESRSQALRRLMSLERSLAKKNQQTQFNSVIQEYIDLGHAEVVPVCELIEPKHNVYYLPMHVVYKDSSTTTKIRAVFDASAKSMSGVSLNDSLLVGPTVHAPLLDVLLRFRMHRIALTTDISKMYRAVALAEADRDLHRFLWRRDYQNTVNDYRMTRVTFGISASSFVANMRVRQNAIDLASEYPMAAKAAEESFYVDDGLTGADDIQTAIRLQRELDNLFRQGGFILHKWNSNEPSVLQHIDLPLRNSRDTQEIAELEKSTKTLGIEWITTSDEFCLTMHDNQHSRQDLTKRTLISDIAQIFDVLGWFSPSIVMMKILLQKFWEEKIDWDDVAPFSISDVWHRWRDELPILKSKRIPRCYFSRNSFIVSRQLHGFSDASEAAYAAVIYMRTTDSHGEIHTSLVISKTKVSPIKRQTIPRLELCGALLLAKLLDHTRKVLQVGLIDCQAWTDSTVVLSWLTGNPRRFKTFVGNRVSQIIDCIPPDRWKHVAGIENPADCASRGLFPSELADHRLWWDGPTWLKSSSKEWPQQPPSMSEWHTPVSASEVCFQTSAPVTYSLVLPADRYSSFDRLSRVISWIIRFVHNCRTRVVRHTSCHLTTSELHRAERYIFTVVQSEQFPVDIGMLKSNHSIPKNSRLVHISPFIDSNGLLRVGGRQRLGHLSYSRTHPIILHGDHPIVI